MLLTLFSQFDNIVVLDTETTGIDCRREEIIELAAIRISRENTDAICEEMDDFLYLSEGKHLPEEIVALTGITEEMIRQEGVRKQVAAERFCAMIAHPKTLLVAYNAQFDMCFLYYFLARFGRADVLRDIRMLDAMTVYRDRRDYPHKLKDAIAAYGVDAQNSHRAVDDTKAALAVLDAMERERGDLASYINLFGYNRKYGVSGQRIRSVRYIAQGYDRSVPLYMKAE